MDNKNESTMKMSEEELKGYEGNYSESGFWAKLRNFAKKAGLKVVYLALVLYYVAHASTTSTGAKGVIYGALGYFILPIDLVPDGIPVVGFSDDLAALTFAIAAVASSVTPEIKAMAKAKLSEWFGNYDETEIADFVR